MSFQLLRWFSGKQAMQACQPAPVQYSEPINSRREPSPQSCPLTSTYTCPHPHTYIIPHARTRAHAHTQAGTHTLYHTHTLELALQHIYTYSTGTHALLSLKGLGGRLLPDVLCIFETRSRVDKASLRLSMYLRDLEDFLNSLPFQCWNYRHESPHPFHPGL